MGPHFLSFFGYKTTSTNNLWKHLCAQHDQFFLSLFTSIFARSNKQKKKKKLLPLDRDKERVATITIAYYVFF